MLYRNYPMARWRARRCAPLDPPRQAEGLTLGVWYTAPLQSAPGMSRIGNPPPQPGSPEPATVQFSSSTATQKTNQKKRTDFKRLPGRKIGPKRNPKATPKSEKCAFRPLRCVSLDLFDEKIRWSLFRKRSDVLTVQ